MALRFDQDTMYQALLDRDPEYDRAFYVCVRSTGVFCRSVCPARKPLAENVEFVESVRDALTKGYRPCKRCEPLSDKSEDPDWVRSATARIEADPQSRLSEKDLRAMGIEPERLRRYFQRRYGMTFQTYARARRLGSAMRLIREGETVLETAMDTGFDSSSGFREAFQKLFGTAPSRSDGLEVITVKWIETPLGGMIAAATDEALVMLEFSDRRMLETQIKVVRQRFGLPAVPGDNAVLTLIADELDAYFRGELREFRTPIVYPGTEFQARVWDALRAIPYGQTRSYSQLAQAIGSPAAVRAVGKANGDNRVAILIPCHRVINADGSLCGYGGGLWRKARLLEIESGQGALLDGS